MGPPNHRGWKQPAIQCGAPLAANLDGMLAEYVVLSEEARCAAARGGITLSPTRPSRRSQKGRSAHDDVDHRRHRVYRPAADPAFGEAGRGLRGHGHQPADRQFQRVGQGAGAAGRCQPVRDVMAAMTAVKPDRVINLAYYISSDLPPRVAFKLNVLGMDNCFEAARLAGCNRVVYASSVAVSGEQKFYGERIVNEDDFKHGHVQYAMHKIFNEWQAQDYREKHAMEITTIRPANVTGPDKVVGSVDHVFCITHPARGKPAVALPA